MSTTSPYMNVSVEAIYQYARSPFGISEQLLPEIRLLLDSVNEELNEHDNEISRLENQLIFLRAQQKWIQKKAVVLRSLLAPIYCLPNELLTQIFDDVCENAVGPGSYELSKAPFDLSAVCSRWRSLCLSHSRMWSKFAVDCSEGAKLGTAVDLYLERSKQQLLTLRLAYHPLNEFGHSATFLKLVRCCARWRHVKLQLQFLSLEFPYLSGLDFPALESLSFDVTEHNVVELGIFVRSPKLQVLEARPRLIPNQDVLGRITKLSYDTGHLHKVLSLCSNLRTLVAYDDDNGIGISGTPIVIPTLTSLHVEGGTNFRGTFFLLTLPALTNVKIIQFCHDSNVTCWNIERFLDRSGCSLTTLIITASWTDKIVVALLRRLPSLQELTILDCKLHVHSRFPRPITKVLVESLYSYQQSHYPIVPKLHSLSLDVASTGFDHKSFVEMISSRWFPDKDFAASIGVSCIRSVELRLSECVDHAEYLPLIRLRKMGLCFSLQCGSA